MQESDINKIIRKYFTGSASEREARQLKRWLDSSAVNRDTFDSLELVWKERSSEPELVTSDEMIDKIWYEGVEQPRFKFSNYRDWDYFYKVAMVVLIFIMVPLVEYKLLRDSIREPAAVSNSIVKRESLAGQKTRINLPDGSVAWLNGASSISYSSHFSDSIRMIELSGEGFFEVMKNPDCPFVVKSGDLKTRALGTSFNINAYPGLDLVKVSLVTGKVEIENDDADVGEISLNPGYELVYNNLTHNYVERTFNPEDVTGWKEGKLVFNAADYQEVVNKIKIWYGIEIKTFGEPPVNLKLTTVYNNESLVNILRNIRFGKEFNYELNEYELKIKFR